MRNKRGGQQVEIRGVGQHAAVQHGIVRKFSRGAKPDVLLRRALFGRQRVPRLGGFEFNRQFAGQRFACARVQTRHGVGPLPAQYMLEFERFRRWHLRHRQLMIVTAGFRFVKRGDHREDRRAVLNRLHAPRGE